MYQVLRKQNDWLKDLVGSTYNTKTLNKVNSFYSERFNKFSVRTFNKFSLVTCLDNAKKNQEILSMGGSSLLQHKKTKEIIPNLILNNFGYFLAAVFSPAANPQPALTIANVIKHINLYRASNNLGNVATNLADIKLGSGLNAPARGDVEIQTALGNAPESGHLGITSGAYTVSNTVIFQGDANPTGGTGTVNEIGLYGFWINGDDGLNNYYLLAHDSISPGVSYASGRLLRGSYTWQI
jgi:hypothetical protein